jgi:signal transduction histidine kinase
MQKVHWLAKPRSWLAAGLMVLLSPVLAQATTWSIDEIQWPKADGHGSQTLALPHVVKHEQEGLLTVRWRILLPPALKSVTLPTLLIPQPIQGFRLRLDGELIHEMASSDEQVLRNWFSPALIQLPKPLIQSTDSAVLEFEQTGHLPSWVIAPMLVGEWHELQPMAQRYAFVIETLTTSVNFASGFVGLFLLILGWRLSIPLYRYSGLIAVLWSAMVGMAFIDSMPASWHFAWRSLLYWIIGFLIYFEIRFNLAIEQLPLPQPLALGLLIYLGAGGVIFVVLGQSAQFALDTWWTALAVILYLISLVGVLVLAMLRRHWRNVVPLLIFLLSAFAFALHDYSLQTGQLWLSPWLDASQDHTFEPVYMTHFILPVFLIMTLWLVGKDFVVVSRRQTMHEHEMTQNRERWVSDIHDGVGARINLLLWRLRTTEPTASAITHELHRCVEELRFAINPPTTIDQTLHQALSALVDRLQAHAPPGLVLTYERTGERTQALPSDIGLHLYKAVHECLSNALRHSAASHISVRLDQRNPGVEVSVSDNGRGIPRWNNEQQVQIERSASSLGLQGIRSRMQSRQGRCFIESSPSGTQVRLAFDV